MRGLARRKAALARRRALRELPQDDGLIPILGQDRWGKVVWLLVPPKAVEDHMAANMARHDARSARERWGGNQWGEEWVQKPLLRDKFARRVPLLKTDLGFHAWCRAIRRVGEAIRR